MKNFRNLLFYVITIGTFSLLMYFTVLEGNDLQPQEFSSPLSPSTNGFSTFWETLTHNLSHPLAILLLQIITIILTARCFSWICKKIGQPTVIGEIAAGIFLGPSFIGMYFPEFSGFLFPLVSLPNLQFLSQIGLILFMFIIGMELDIKVLRNRANDAIVVSHASIIFPFALGMILSYFIYQEYAPENINFLSFGLFVGIAMSITAFPVLARIVQERSLAKTRLGTLAITCAAADDITAWCLLAAVIAIVKAGSFVSALYVIALAVGYVIIMLRVVRPLLKRIGDIHASSEGLSKPVVGIFFLTLLLSSYATEVIGIHALFGAFMAGVIMPANINFRNIFIEKVEDVSLVLLLPLFFVFTGLRTEIGLLDQPHLWKTCGIIIGIAIIGKFVGSALAARFVGQNWHDSLTIGALMNTRGLMELVVLNIGYDLGVIGPEIFAMMVIMALVTTTMTGPALDLINKWLPTNEPIPTPLRFHGVYKILIAFANPLRGRSMLRLAHAFTRKSAANTSISAIHLSPSSELNQYNIPKYERESFLPIKREAQKLGLPVQTYFKAADDLDAELAKFANEGNYDLLIVGMGQSVFEGTVLGRIIGFTSKVINPQRIYKSISGKANYVDQAVFDKRTSQILKSVKIPIGVLIDKNFQKADRIIAPILTPNDGYIIQYLQKFINQSGASIMVIDTYGIVKSTPELKEAIRSIEQTAPDHISVFTQIELTTGTLSSQDLVVVSLHGWQTEMEKNSAWLAVAPSVLIIKP